MTPVDVRGTIYRSITAAAIGEGVHPRTVHKHLDAGTPHLIGVQPQTNRRACEFDGIAYPSFAAAAKATGRHIQSISRQVNRQRDRSK